MNYKMACKALQVGPKPQMTIGHVLINFKSMITTDNIPENLSREDFIKAKNILLRKLIDEQIREKGKFDLQGVVKDACPACYGAGEIYKFYRQAIKVPCRCENGKVNLGECWACKGTGRYERVDTQDPGLRYKLNCNKCTDGQKVVTCKFCRGEGVRKRFVIAKIQDAKTCFKCKGVGFKLPKNLNFFNPLPLGNLAEVTQPDETLAEVIEETGAEEKYEHVECHMGKDDGSDAWVEEPKYVPTNIPWRTCCTVVDDDLVCLIRDCA